MSNGVKLIVIDDPWSNSIEFSGTAIRLRRITSTLKGVLDRKNELWQLEEIDESCNVAVAKNLETKIMVSFLEQSQVDNLFVSINDCVHLLDLIARPRVSLDLAGSTFPYFERERIYEHVLFNVLIRRLNLPIPQPQINTETE